VRRWRARYEAGGPVALYDRRRVRPSRLQAPAPEVQRILRLYRERFAGWNVRHFYRFARREHAVRLSYSFVKLALQEAGLVRKARARGIALELNAHPDRLDLTDTHCRMAKEEGVLVAISSDAHTTLDLENLRFGVGQARRGWLEKADVLNTRPLAELRRIIDRGQAGDTRPASPRRAARVRRRVRA